MQYFNDAFTAELLNRSADFRFTIEITFDDAGTNLLYFTSHADGAFPVGADVVENAIVDISSFSERLDNRYSRALIGSLSFVVGDFSGETRAWFADRLDNDDLSVFRKKVVVYAGFKDLDWVDYEAIDTFYIDKITNTGPGWQIEASDIQKELREKIFVPHESTLSNSITEDATSIPLTLASTTGQFPTVEHDSFYSDRPGETVGYIKIDDEIIAHSGFSGSSLVVVERGALNTLAEPHESDSSASADKRKKVKEVVYIEGRAPDLIHQLLCGTSVDGNRTIPSHWHAGIDTSLVDTDSFSNIGEDLYSSTGGRLCDFIGEEDRDVKQFIEEQLFRWCGLYMTQSPTSVLVLSRYARKLSGAAFVEEITDAQLKKIGSLTAAQDDMVNVITVRWGYNHATEETIRKTVLLDTASIARHSQVRRAEFEFRGVHSRIHTDADIRGYFDTFRDLYSNPPYELNVTVDHRYLGLRVGDPVRINTAQRGDYIDDTDLDRTFEIRGRQVDYGTGAVSLELIGTGVPASAILQEEAESSTGELNSGWYTGTGTDLDLYSEFTSGAQTADKTITGNADATNAGAIYYHSGDLTINSGVTLTGTQNIWLRIDGFLTINGTISTKGQGLSGTPGNHADTALAGMGTAGAYFNTLPGAGVDADADAGNTDIHKVEDAKFWGESMQGFSSLSSLRSSAIHAVGSPILGFSSGPFKPTKPAAPVFDLKNQNGTLAGVPTDLRGSSGGAGTPVWRTSPAPSQRVANGGDGGDGGGGLIITCKGIAFGVSGSIDTSGTDGTLGQTAVITATGGDSATYRGGSGAGGAPGVLLIIIDGDFSLPALGSTHIANQGDSPAPSDTSIPIQFGSKVAIDPDSESSWRANLRGGRGWASWAYGEAANRVQYVPYQEAPEADTAENPARQLDQVTGVSVTSDSTTVDIHANGSVSEYAVVTWTAISDEAIEGYQVQAKRTADSTWKTVAITSGATDNTANVDVEDGTQYDIRVRAFSSRNNVIHGPWSSTETHTATGASDLSAIAAPANVSISSGIATILVLSDNSTVNRMKVTWDASGDSLWTGTEIEFKKNADSAWQTHQLVESSNVTESFIPAEAGVLYDIRLRHLSRTRPNSTYTSTTHTVTTVSAITAPANVSVQSGTAQLKTLSDGSIIERMLVTWDASADQYWTATEVEFKKSADSDWDSAGLIQSSNVTQIYIEGEGGTNYDIRLRHLSNAKPNSSYTSVSGHTLVGEDQPPSDVTNFKAAQNGELVNFTYDLIGDADRNGYIIRYGVTGISWEDAKPLTEETKGTKITSAYVPPSEDNAGGTWDFLIKAIDRSQNVSDNAARTTLAVVSGFDIVSKVSHDPGWKTGTVNGYWIHYHRMLVPLDQNAASTYGYEMFDSVVPNPVATSTYTSDEQDGLVQARMRIWANIDSVLASGETGVANPQLSVDYKDDGGAYDGFEDWTIEQVNARYAKFKLTNDNVNDGIAIIRGFKTVVDAVERKESAQNVTIAAGGTAITFDDEFRQTPFISVFSESGGGLIPDSAGDSTTGFTFHLYNSSGTSVGGTGKWVAEGI